MVGDWPLTAGAAPAATATATAEGEVQGEEGERGGVFAPKKPPHRRHILRGLGPISPYASARFALRSDDRDASAGNAEAAADAEADTAADAGAARSHEPKGHAAEEKWRSW